MSAKNFGCLLGFVIGRVVPENDKRLQYIVNRFASFALISSVNTEQGGHTTSSLALNLFVPPCSRTAAETHSKKFLLSTMVVQARHGGAEDFVGRKLSARKSAESVSGVFGGREFQFSLVNCCKKMGSEIFQGNRYVGSLSIANSI